MSTQRVAHRLMRVVDLARVGSTCHLRRKIIEQAEGFSERRLGLVERFVETPLGCAKGVGHGESWLFLKRP